MITMTERLIVFGFTLCAASVKQTDNFLFS
jgi:hypothetical protein